MTNNFKVGDEVILMKSNCFSMFHGKKGRITELFKTSEPCGWCAIINFYGYGSYTETCGEGRTNYIFETKELDETLKYIHKKYGDKTKYKYTYPEIDLYIEEINTDKNSMPICIFKSIYCCGVGIDCIKKVNENYDRENL